MIARLDWGDPRAIAAWAKDLRTQMDDAIAAGLDATAPEMERELGPRAARRTITEAAAKIGEAFRFAGLAEDDDAPPASGTR